MKKFRVLICGDREWSEAYPIRRELLRLDKEGDIEFVVHGDCRGADRISGVVAANLGIDVKREPAKWAKHGKAAGPVRNRLMEKKYKPNIGLAFHKDLRKSKGTKDMLQVLLEAGIEVRVFTR